ncbi:RadC DNA repair proteins [uncultured Caudovirales phage]|uniref:RadC DNA repair proteins n=1 Tax=uncultured Caudovirales phage TaxID=2100421 RepID=A0A6J5NLV6_9CAUD|nr:RadC DNA repair proteins [uncultured Caudovirales phage]
MHHVCSVEPPAYTDAFRMTPEEAATVAHALNILGNMLKATGAAIDTPQVAKDYVMLRIGGQERESFMVVFLDSQHHVIAAETLFHGSLSQTSVYPREVVRRALQLNAGAVILAHNHPSGSCEPSRADEHLTQTLKAALTLVDVRVLDHLVVSGNRCVSFAERGLL